MAIQHPIATDPTSEAARFVQAFADFWDKPTLPSFQALMHPDVRLIQPLAPPARGLAEASAWFESTKALLPDIRITVDRWSGTADALFIEWTATATFGGRPVSWHAVDRFRLEGGKARERVAYFDALPLVGTILSRPAGWPGLIRARLSRGGSS
jgi:ketosteroid isomerase-like protein